MLLRMLKCYLELLPQEAVLDLREKLSQRCLVQAGGNRAIGQEVSAEGATTCTLNTMPLNRITHETRLHVGN